MNIVNLLSHNTMKGLIMLQKLLIGSYVFTRENKWYEGHSMSNNPDYDNHKF